MGLIKIKRYTSIILEDVIKFDENISVINQKQNFN